MIERFDSFKNKKGEWFRKKNREGVIRIKEFDCGCIFEGEFIGSKFRGNVILCNKHLLEIKQRQTEE